VNFEHNVALWGAHAADADGDGKVTNAEYAAMLGALSSTKADGSQVINSWPAAETSVTIDAVADRSRLLALFAQDWALNKGGDSDIGFHAWAATGEQPYSKVDAEKEKVGAVDYVEKSEFIKAVAATTEACTSATDTRQCYLTKAGEDDLRWIYDPTLKSDKLNKLWCTELTLKTSDYSEVTQNILDGQDGAPAYSEPTCGDIDYNANFSNFARAFITLIRVSTGEFWNGIMHELMGLGHTWAFLYFFTYLILAQMIMLNLVVAVLLINYDDQQQKDRKKAADEANKQKEIDNANGALSSTGTVADKYSVPEEANAGKTEKETEASADPSQPSESPSDPEAPGLKGSSEPSAVEEGP